jgi:transposase
MADAMHEAMLDAKQEGGSYRRIEVITGHRRRRRWTAEEKARIVAESFEEGANISEVARRHGACPWVAQGVAAQVRDGSELAGAGLRAGPDRF